jgi:hypothetical protein
MFSKFELYAVSHSSILSYRPAECNRRQGGCRRGNGDGLFYAIFGWPTNRPRTAGESSSPLRPASQRVDRGGASPGQPRLKHARPSTSTRVAALEHRVHCVRSLRWQVPQVNWASSDPRPVERNERGLRFSSRAIRRPEGAHGTGEATSASEEPFSTFGMPVACRRTRFRRRAGDRTPAPAQRLSLARQPHPGPSRMHIAQCDGSACWDAAVGSRRRHPVRLS